MIVYGVACEEYVNTIQAAIGSRLTALNVPLESVDFRVQERPYPAIMGVNKIEECRPPHSAGFGGYYHEPPANESDVYVYLLDPSQEAAREMMEYQLGSREAAWSVKIHPLQGQFTFNRLEDWRGRFVDDIRRHPVLKLGVRKGSTLRSVKTDPHLNRLRFVIREDANEAATRQAITERLATLDIPLEAVVIELEPPQ